ncbi:MAG TPA: methyltransferase domain-containing protein [Candidatus Dormibacteraeota bacterium]|nr:methyltransferase domain-containing protein [Candidatus Dormibacteraeota bacterium]
MSEMDTDGHEDRIAADYDGSAEAFARSAHAVYARLAEPLVAAAAVQPGESVLDVATGTGAVGGRLAGAVVGLDVSAEQLRQNPLTDKHVGAAEHMPFADATFDVVVCGFGINHFTRPRIALDEVRRVLKPGGRLALSTWLRPQPEYAPKEIVLRALERHAGRSRTPAAEVVDALSERLGTVDALSALLSEAGFSGVRVTVKEVEIPWPGPTAFVDYRLAMLGAGAMLSTGAEGELRREVGDALRTLSRAQLHWLPQVLLGTALLRDV